MKDCYFVWFLMHIGFYFIVFNNVNEIAFWVLLVYCLIGRSIVFQLSWHEKVLVSFALVVL